VTDTIIGVYNAYTDASRSREELIARGFPSSQVQLSSGDETAATGDTTTSLADTEHGSAIGNFFRSLFGSADNNDDAHVYSEALRRGKFLVTVTAQDENQSEEAVEILSKNGAIDINDQSETWELEGQQTAATAGKVGAFGTEADIVETTPGKTAGMPSMSETGIEPGARTAMPGAAMAGNSAMAENQAIPVIQEELKVGKREIDRGGVRVYRRIEETPVHESVQLRQEEVLVDRTPVDRPATKEQLSGAFTEGTLEVRERGEEAVVEKTARVVEEVRVGKEVHAEVHNIDDTLRRTDVEIEQIPGNRTATSVLSDRDAFRTHWQSNYSTLGGSYDDYEPAYQYGSTLSSDDRYRGSEWSSIENNVRSDWETRHPGSAWERMKGAVRHGWESMTGAR